MGFNANVQLACSRWRKQERFVLFDSVASLCANTDPQRHSLFTKGPADVPDHASEIAVGGKPGIDATKELPGEDFKRPWPPFIRMDAA